MKNGLLIAIEGIDQSGKATQTEMLAGKIEDAGYTVCTMGFPIYETGVGALIREHLVGHERYDPTTLQLLHTTNRFEVRQSILDRLTEYDAVVLDRYVGSGEAYACVQGVDTEWLRHVAEPLPKADATFLLDIGPSESARRKKENRDVYERDLGLLARVRDEYLRMAERESWTVVAADAEPETVLVGLWRVVSGMLDGRG